MPTAGAVRTSQRDPKIVWDGLWSHAPSDARDDELIARERRSVRWKMVLDRLQEEFGGLAGLRTIELGSGRGDFSALLAQGGAKVTLLDASEAGLNQARRRFGRLGIDGEFVRADLFDAAATGYRGFDVSLSSGVIEHFLGQRRTEAVAAHRGVLRDGGLAVISVPNACCLSYRVWKRYLELRRAWPYGVEVPYSRRELARRGRAAGFRRVDATGAGFWHSVGDHVGKGLLGRGRDWAHCPSILDRAMGLSVVLFGLR